MLLYISFCILTNYIGKLNVGKNHYCICLLDNHTIKGEMTSQVKVTNFNALEKNNLKNIIQHPMANRST